MSAEPGTGTLERREPAAKAERSTGMRIVRGFGWTFITLGVLLLLFVAYQFFFTNLITDRYQSGLRDSLARQFRAEPGRPPRPIPGEALGILRIPSINPNVAVVEGTNIEDLKKGPGHYEDTPLPGEPGNVGVAGHRTTYGKHFWSLDKVQRGDQVFFRTSEGVFTYEVRWQKVVLPHQTEVLNFTKRPSITLTTCNPRFSAAERLILRAVLVDAPEGVEAPPVLGAG